MGGFGITRATRRQSAAKGFTQRQMSKISACTPTSPIQNTVQRPSVIGFRKGSVGPQAPAQSIRRRRASETVCVIGAMRDGNRGRPVTGRSTLSGRQLGATASNSTVNATTAAPPAT